MQHLVKFMRHFFVAGAAFGEVHVSLFVAGAAFVKFMRPFLWQVQHLVKFMCHFLWPVQHLVKFMCHFFPEQFTVGVLNATLDLAALVLVGAVGFLGSEMVLSPVVSHCLRLSPFMWGVGVGWCGRLLGL